MAKQMTTPSEAEPEAPARAVAAGYARLVPPAGAASCSFRGEVFEAGADGEIHVPNEALAELAAHGFTRAAE